jgi:hypothetical protein
MANVSQAYHWFILRIVMPLGVSCTVVIHVGYGKLWSRLTADCVVAMHVHYAGCEAVRQYTVISCQFREQSKLLTRGAGYDLRTVLKWSPAPRDNNFDSSLNRHEITVLLSYIHALNHKSTEDDNVSIPYLVTLEKRLTGMMHCASFSGMEQFGSGGRGTVNCFTLPAIFKFFLVIS